jgi:hypothetical protein
MVQKKFLHLGSTQKKLYFIINIFNYLSICDLTMYEKIQ